MHYTWNLLFSYEVICITTQKIQHETTPSFMKQGEINQDKKFFKLYTSLHSSVHIHPCQFESHMFMITIENLLFFLEYFDDKIISMKNFPFRLCKSLFHPFLFWFFAQNAKRFEREKIVKCSPAILDLITWPTTLVCSSVSLFIKCYRHFAIWIMFDSCSSKRAEENEENIVKLNVSLNRQKH